MPSAPDGQFQAVGPGPSQPISGHGASVDCCVCPAEAAAPLVARGNPDDTTAIVAVVVEAAPGRSEVCMSCLVSQQNIALQYKLWAIALDLE